MFVFGPRWYFSYTLLKAMQRENALKNGKKVAKIYASQQTGTHLPDLKQDETKNAEQIPQKSKSLMEAVEEWKAENAKKLHVQYPIVQLKKTLESNVVSGDYIDADFTVTGESSQDELE